MSQTRYFNENAEELILGFNMADISEAAYTTVNANDPILKPAGEGMRWIIENGVPTQVKKGLSKRDLENYIKQQRDETIRRGIFVTSTFIVNGQTIPGHRQNVRLTDRIRTDVASLIMDYFTLGNEGTTLLKVGTSAYFVIDNGDKVKKLFEAGRDLIKLAYTKEAECMAMIKAANVSEYDTLQRTLRSLWTTVVVDRVI